VILEHNLMRWVLELLRGEPYEMSTAPVFSAAIDPTLPKQESQQLPLGGPKVLHRVGARADQIAHCFVRGIRHPHRRQLTGPQQPRKLDCIKPIGFDSLPWPARDRAR